MKWCERNWIRSQETTRILSKWLENYKEYVFVPVVNEQRWFVSNNFGKVISDGSVYFGKSLWVLRQRSNESRQIVKADRREQTFYKDKIDEIFL